MASEHPADGTSSVQEHVEGYRKKETIEKQKPSRAVLTLTTMATILAVIALLGDVAGTLLNRTHPGETEEYYQQGLSYEIKGEYENAIASYQKEIEVNPENAAAYNALAWLYTDKLETNLDDAIALARTAVELTENEKHPSRDYWLANYLDTLGWAYYKNGDYTEAVETLERAVALDDRRSFAVHLEAARTALNSSQDVEP